MSTLRNIQSSLLDDLRNATEFYMLVQDAKGDDQAAAREWLANAALQLGEALIAAHAASEAPHA